MRKMRASLKPRNSIPIISVSEKFEIGRYLTFVKLRKMSKNGLENLVVEFENMEVELGEIRLDCQNPHHPFIHYILELE